MARKFLYLVVVVIVLTIGAMFALRYWADDLTAVAFVPKGEFVEQDALAANAYQDPAMWFSRPGLGVSDPARWQPAFAADETGAAPSPPSSPSSASSPSPTPSDEATPGDPPVPAFAVFFVHPTSYFDRAQWNAPLDDEQSQNRARLFLRGMASPFNQAAEIWAPRYRQAAFGAFLTDEPQADQAIEAAYRDVEQAFAYFVDSIGPNTPIVLAGHSQGAAHVLRLLHDRIAGTPIEQRVAMVYAIGWPLSIAHDLPALPLPACATPDQTRCIAGWSSFAEPANPGIFMTRYEASPGFDGQPRGNDPILCFNPLTGTINGTAPASENLGTLKPSADLSTGQLIRGMVPARCDAQGLLLIGDAPDMGPGVLPGNNYHVYDIPLFWRNLQLDAGRRMRAWATAR
ncbi:MAG TPA: DUF3089 domain-containing protein [Croceibacterium sp.]|nr:DUF3089 domain-containing protein [Croceibacterium sp.]